MSNELPVVVIDPGHGGTKKVGGSSANNASGPNGLQEKDVTLALALQVEWWLNSMGNVRVILTRRTDTNLPLIDRAQVAKDNDAALFLSIHLNSPEDPVKDRDVDGTEAWVARKASTQSRAFAQTVAAYVSAMAGIRNRGVKEGDLGVLLPERHAPTTAACLVEAAFLTNPAEAKRLESDGYRGQLAEAMAEAILRYLPASVAAAHSMAMAGVGSSSGPSISTSSHSSEIGSGFSVSEFSSSTLETITLGYGVPGGKITDPFYNDAAEKLKLTGRQHGRARHLGMDVTLSNEHGGGADDPRRGLPVYAVVKPSINISELNAVRAIDSNGYNRTGLGIPGQGTATLQHAIVIVQPWSDRADHSYGGILGLACRYAYTKYDGSPGRFTIYLEYMHLITPDFLPKDGDGNIIPADAWRATGKGIGFGPQMQNHAQLSAAQLTAGTPPLVGYLGATQFPHVHINAAFGDGTREYIKYPRFDPSVMLINSVPMTQTQAIESLGLSTTNDYGNGTHGQGYNLADTGTDTLTHAQALSLLNAAGVAPPSVASFPPAGLVSTAKDLQTGGKSMGCSKVGQLKVGNTSIWRLQGQTPFFYEAGLEIDADGAPQAYHPEPHSNLGLDFLANAGHPGNWFGIVTDNDHPSGNPIVQGSDDPAPGFYVSSTSLQDKTKDRTDPLRYVDATQIPYIVLPPEVRSKLGAQPGDFAVVISSKSGKISGAIFADIGPRGKIGEGSIALANNLIIPSSPKHGGTKSGLIYVVFPGSGNGKPRSIDEIVTEAGSLFQAMGGMGQIQACFPELAPLPKVTGINPTSVQGRN